jgi:DNA polymerase III delta subunit
MKFIELKNDIVNGARSIYLIEGDDAYFRAKAEEQIKKAFLQMPELNYSSYDGSMYKGAQLSEITAAAQSFPFMSEKRIIKIVDFFPTESDYEKYLAPTFDNLPDSTIILIVNSQGKKGADLKKKKCVTFVDCAKTDGETVTKWAYLTFKRAGIAAQVDACEAIAAYCLNDMARVSVEVEKLIEYSSGTISKADVDEMVFKDADYRVYEMTGALARKNYNLFTQVMYDLLSKSYDENFILASLLSYFKNLLTITESNMSDKQLADALKMKEYGVKKSREQADAIGKKRLLDFVQTIYSLIADIKSGKLTPVGALSIATQKVFFA